MKLEDSLINVDIPSDWGKQLSIYRYETIDKKLVTQIKKYNLRDPLNLKIKHEFNIVSDAMVKLPQPLHIMIN